MRTFFASSVSHLDTPEAKSSLAAQARFFFAQTSPQLLLVNALALAGVRACCFSWVAADAVVLLATAAWWPVQEWLFHKVLLHLEPRTVFGRRIDPLFARTHREHHAQPWMVDKTLLPPAVILALIPLQLGVWLAALPTFALGLTAATTYAASAVVYEWTHYLCHSHYVPQGAYYRRIHRNHRLHHHKSDRSWFSFTAPALDELFGTNGTNADQRNGKG